MRVDRDRSTDPPAPCYRAVAPRSPRRRPGDGSPAAMAFNHLPAAMHDALGALSVTPVTHSVPMAKNH
ncbi:hypothetical protein, partial [Streptomyces sp. NRRL S-1896]|uniref:hypothetical protein n=1 Tax=Streptomyces sp. NRRL S-1896 TaxID=1463893 RepID=UPI003B635EE5